MKKALLLLPLALAACGQNPFLTTLGVTVNPGSVTLAPGQTTHLAVSASSGEHQAVPGLTVDDAQLAGLSLAGETNRATLTAAPDAKAGVYALPLHARAPGAQGDTSVQVTVTDLPAAPTPPAGPDFSLAVTPNSPTLSAGTSTHLAVTVIPSGGFRAPTTLEVSGALTVTPDPDGAGFTVSGPASTTPGSHALTVTVTGGGLTHSAQVTVTVGVPTSGTSN